MDVQRNDYEVILKSITMLEEGLLLGEYMKKKLINLFILLFFIILTLYILIANGDIEQIPALIEKMNMNYFWVAMALMFVYLIANGVQIRDLVKSTGYTVNYLQAFFLGVVGMYYGLLTPFATGGQPGQIYVMKKQYGIPVTVGTSVTLKKSIVYQVTITLLVIGMFIYQLPFLTKTEPKLLPLIIIGVMCNLVGSIFFALALYNARFLLGIMKLLLNFITKFRLFQKLNKEKIYTMVSEYAEVMNGLKKKKMLMLRQIVITTIQHILFFSVTYFVYLSFGYSGAPFMKIFALQVILYTVVSFVPTPGGAGASELGFYAIFTSFFTTEVLIYATIMWRVVNYYAIILFGGILILINSLLNKRKNSRDTKTRLHNLKYNDHSAM